MKKTMAIFTLLVTLLLPNAVLAETKVVLLGTGTPVSEPHRSGPAVAVVVDDSAYLIDAGTGLVRKATAAFMNGVSGLSPNKLDTVFITHLHSDHTIGLPDLMTTPWILGRRNPLRLFGPEGSKEMMENLYAAYKEDREIRMNGLEGLAETGGKVEVAEIKEGRIFDNGIVKVDAMRVPHGAWKSAFALKFTTPDKVVVISGDTAPTSKMVEFAKGCDILVHEVYLERPFKAGKWGWPEYHLKSHTSTSELVELAKLIKPKQLVMYHILTWGMDPSFIEDEIIAAGYKGKFYVGEDLDVF